MAPDESFDILIAGAGFGAVDALRRLRPDFKIQCLEKAGDFGGIWFWNCYPGARVDSDQPIYQLFDKEIWEGFTFTERYPGWQEIRRYFEYLDKKFELRKDIKFNCAVTHAKFDESKHKWHIVGSDGSEYLCRWFIPAIGFASKKFVPDYPGIERFKGEMHHTCEWPQQGLEMKGKRIAVIGTGASGVQTIQEVGEDAKQLTVYQRTPNLALPMNQHKLTKEDNDRRKAAGEMEKTFELTHSTFAGFAYDFIDKNTFDDSPEDRRKFYEQILLKDGGFKFWLANYKDLLFDEKANAEAYYFWRDTVRARIKDPRKADILAPMEPPHWFGTKRPSLEQYYYEIYNLPHVEIIDCKADPIKEITETGIKTESGKGDAEFDVIVLATGFDSVTGSLAQMDLTSADGESVKQHWDDGLKTAIGVSLNNFPNMFFLYGPQAPTAFSNGPTCTQVQNDWLCPLLKELKKKGVTRFEAKPETEVKWTETTKHFWDLSLFPQTKSWYSGANIPGKRVEPLNFPGGIPTYVKALEESLENNYQSWIVS